MTRALIRSGNELGIQRRVDSAQSSDLSYTEVGATLVDRLPEGYRHIRAERALGMGVEEFRVAVRGLRAWQPHEGSRTHVRPQGTPVAIGETVVLVWGVAGFALALPCRIVGVIDDDRRYAFAYGTLPGHAETGEEMFEVRWTDSEQVIFTVRAFSKPAAWYSKITGPIARTLQDRATCRYLDALEQYVSKR